MFENEKKWGPAHGVVLTESQELTCEQKQRDVYEAHRHRVFSLSYYMTANEVDAEQILTSTFIDAFDREQQPDGHAVDAALLRELEERFSLRDAEPPATATGEALDGVQVRRTDLEEAVATLPPRERLIFLLRDVEGYLPGRVAALLQCEETEIGQALFSARIRMRNALAAARRQRLPASA